MVYNRAYDNHVELIDRALELFAAYRYEVGGERLLIALNIEGPGEQPALDMSEILEGEGELRRPGHNAAAARLPEQGWAILAP